MIENNGKVDKTTLTTDSAILIFPSLLKKELHHLKKLFFNEERKIRITESIVSVG